MANGLTGKFDVVAEFGIQAVNRVLAAQHQDETYLHSIPAVVPAEGLPWVRIDDTETGVRGIAQIQVSTPTITLPTDENASKVTIHYQLMAHMVADNDSAAVPKFVHGEIQVTLAVAQEEPWEDGDVIEIDLRVKDLEVTFTPEPEASLSAEETDQVNQIIRNVLGTGFEPVSTVVDLPGSGEALRVQQWWFKTMPGDQRPAVALLLNLSDKVLEPEPRASVREVFLEEEDDFAIAVGRDFLESTLLDLMRDALPTSISDTATLEWHILGVRVGAISVSYTVTVDSVSVELVHVEPDEWRIQLSVDGDVTAHVPIGRKWRVDGTFTVTQGFTLIADGGRIGLDAPDDPVVELHLNLPVLAGFAEEAIIDITQQMVSTAREDAGLLVQDLLAAFHDLLPGLRIPEDPDVVYTAAEIQAEGVIIRGTLDFGPWQDVVATFETKFTSPSEAIVLLDTVGSMFQDDLEQGDLSQGFRRILERFQTFPLSLHPDITTEEEGSRWRIDDQGRTYTVVKEGDTLEVYGTDMWKIDYEFNAFGSWIPGGTIQRYWWVYGSDEVISWELSEEHKFKIERTEDLLHIDVRGLNPFNPFRLCLEVSGVRGSPPREVSGWVCLGLAPRPPAVQDAEDGGLFVEVPDSEGGVVAHIDPFWLELPSKLRPGGYRPRRGSTANLLVHFPGSESTQTWSVLRDALVRRSRKDAAVFVVAVVLPGLAIEPLKPEANISWARTEDPERAWAKAFRVTATPTTFVVNPQGKTAWQHVGRLDAAAFIVALDEHLAASGPLRWQQLRLKVRVGQPAPDFIFEYLQGRRIALRRLRRRPVLLSFWKSWSAPCLAELRYLQKLHDRFAREGWVILAINDEEYPQRARQVFEENGFTFAFVADADRQITELYGVNCWPTTVSLSEKGVVHHIQFGVTPGKGSMRL